MSLPYLSAVPGGVEVRILVQPRASRTRVVGEHDGQLKIQLAAPPVDGAANRALTEFLGELLGVNRSAVELLSGDTGRRKRVRIHGLDVARVEAVMNGFA